MRYNFIKMINVPVCLLSNYWIFTMSRKKKKTKWFHPIALIFVIKTTVQEKIYKICKKNITVDKSHSFKK